MNTILYFIIIVLIIIIVVRYVSYKSYLKKNKNRFGNLNADSAKKIADRYNADIVTEYNIIIDRIKFFAEKGEYNTTFSNIRQKVLTKLVENGYRVEKKGMTEIYEIYWDNVFDKKNK